MSKKKAILSTDLSNIIDESLSKSFGSLSASQIADIIILDLSERGYAYSLHEGKNIPLTEYYIKKKIYKRIERLKGKSYRTMALGNGTTSDTSSEGNEIPADKLIESDILKRENKSNYNVITKKYDILLDEYDKLKKVLGIKDDISRPLQSFGIPLKGKESDTSVAVVLASDWHYEEGISPESVNFMNEYTLDIADKRIKNFFGNTVKMLHKEQRDTKINTMILALLGDFITGNIHEDNVESSQLGVGEALWAVKSRIHSGIQFILDNTDVNLVIPCHSGNHGRHTKKQRIANEKDNSLEWLIYKSLAEIWSKNKRVQFMVGDAYHSFVDVFPGYTIRFHHGHNVRYGGGVGGITIPINKAIAQWNRNRSVQLDCMGHFHQYADGGNFVVNSSLIGFSPYAISIKGAYERPSQSFFLINGKYKEKTCSSKIFLDDK